MNYDQNKLSGVLGSSNFRLRKMAAEECRAAVPCAPPERVECRPCFARTLLREREKLEKLEAKANAIGCLPRGER